MSDIQAQQAADRLAAYINENCPPEVAEEIRRLSAESTAAACGNILSGLNGSIEDFAALEPTSVSEFEDFLDDIYDFGQLAVDAFNSIASGGLRS